MRKAQKQQAEELVKQIEEAHGQIKEYIGQGSVQSAMELLEDCQNGGIAIGTLIEDTQGEGHPTVALLEDYCELIYQIHADLADNHKETNANKVYKLLRQKLIKAENSLRNDVPVRTEAVFLPYKASMWDSLESVWKAADADPNCDAYVIPIPYYDKNPDGSFREMHYEGDQYPADVPITDYKEYDFEQRKPDMIYIHNPYDDLNYVTSVPPFFFSENLKKYTEKLVYIPYFILGEIKPDEEERIEGMKHFVTTPGVFNADKVIVQSEDMKQVYIKVLLDATNDHSEVARKYWDNKILGTGSPKIDKVLNTKKEDLEVSQEWLKIIEKPDGSWKKVIFYNTSVGALLQHGEKMITKIKYVLGIFKENQDEVALLWRPHPLIKATIESMRPQLWIEYDRVVRKYQEEGWGIYDDTSDVDRAIVLSDAYYGDGSSIVQMYQHTGKPIMMQNVEILLKEEILFPWNSRIVDIDSEGLFVGSELDMLFRMNFSLNEIQAVCELSDEDIRGFRKNTFCIKYKNKIFIFPDNESNILVLEKGELSRIPLKAEDKRVGIINAYIYGENIFCVSKGLSKIIELDAQHNKISNEYLLTLTDEKLNIGWECMEENEKIYCVSSENNIVVIFDKKTRIIDYVRIPVDCSGFTTICKKADFFYFTGKERCIYKWNVATNEVVKLVTFPENFGMYISTDKKLCLDTQNTKFAEPLFISSIVIENKLYFIPYQSNCILTVDAINDDIKVLFVPNEEEDALSWERGMRHKYLLEYVKNRRYLWLYSFKQKKILEIDLKTEQVSCLDFKYDKQCSKKIHQLRPKQRGGIIYEAERRSLVNLIESDFAFVEST